MFFDWGRSRRIRARTRASVQTARPEEKPAENILWLVYREDIHGRRYLVAEGLDETGADAKKQSFVDKHTKPHGQEYYKLGYTQATRSDVLNRYGILV